MRLGAIRRYTYIEKASAVGGLGLPLHPIRGAPAAGGPDCDVSMSLIKMALM